MAYGNNQPFTYGIPDGTYRGRPVSASCFEKDGRLILDVRFAVKDPDTGEWYKKDNGYEWEANKRHWLTNADGGFNEATIAGIKEWAKGWDPRTFEDFWWFQRPDANGTPFGNLAAVGEVELNFQLDGRGRQNLWVHDPNRAKGAGRPAFVPDGGVSDAAALAAKWGARAKALFAAAPKKIQSAPAAPAAAPAPAPAVPTAPAPAAPVAAPTAPTAPAAAPDFPQTVDGAFAYYRSLLGEPYVSAKHDARWFDIYDGASSGKDPDEFGPDDVRRLFQAIAEEMAK